MKRLFVDKTKYKKDPFKFQFLEKKWIACEIKLLW
jgi:hypothetical protein